MSDFFSRLVQRAMGEGTPVRPLQSALSAAPDFAHAAESPAEPCPAGSGSLTPQPAPATLHPGLDRDGEEGHRQHFSGDPGRPATPVAPARKRDLSLENGAAPEAESAFDALSSVAPASSRPNGPRGAGSTLCAIEDRFHPDTRLTPDTENSPRDLAPPESHSGAENINPATARRPAETAPSRPASSEHRPPPSQRSVIAGASEPLLPEADERVDAALTSDPTPPGRISAPAEPGNNSGQGPDSLFAQFRQRIRNDSPTEKLWQDQQPAPRMDLELGTPGGRDAAGGENRRNLPGQPSRTASKADSSIQQAASVAPTIKVSIGRVEVRAVVAQPPAARPAAAPVPKVSLDEYLKRQSGAKP